ncbi:hypothetical protein TBLA_0A08420 [Henningerozyma blattae CBS 6284]|uniref:Uncharacterized protein n=1 Tax=Henningerozyma blattae (strain ATCC 34711 / CBS 6284 / DSM 70876 / NBRC 10599 / NRRL Y-10934 / UCD 77-7) TaxID=1071380 RepID=I2GWX9_HENB6|nr:hypothetical protein TBLA_0A08420 [Tetrapisispora blattae CBS 6284]CCH58631.1 hypothetical protein TBLA_0A08420 [Tetrapisispora blattae CBS 6284]
MSPAVLKESIPPEIVYQILTYQFRDFMNNDYPNSPEKFNENLRTFLRSNLTVSKTFYHICRVLVYRYCNFTTAKRFKDLLRTIKHNPSLSNAVEIADFQELTSIGLGRTEEMNKMIKNLTNETLLEYLYLTRKSLREFLACEHIQNDLDSKIIYFLLKSGTVLSVIDFCGCSGATFTENFIKAVNKLYPDTNPTQPFRQNYQVTCLGLNDCTDLPPATIGKTLKLFPELQKLDLAHTSIDDEILNSLPHFKNLTHISLSMCSQLTPRGVLEFFAHSSTITDENSTSLQWLNLRVSRTSSSWTEVHTMFLLKKLCQYGHNKTLQYLNIGGLPLHESNDFTLTPGQFYIQTTDSLQFIKWNFPALKSLSIRDNDISVERLSHFLSPINVSGDDDTDSNVDDKDTVHIECKQKLKFINISGNSQINKWTIQDSSIYTSCPTLVAIEVSFDAWKYIEKSNERHEITTFIYKDSSSIIKDIADAKVVKWKCYLDNSYGRRYWIYKIDPYINRGDLDTIANVTKYDDSGNKIVEVIKQPDFLKFAQTKLMLGVGLLPQTRYRRKRCYRDFKPQISNFFTRKGGVTVGHHDSPIVAPLLPPGGWRLMNNDDESDSDLDMSSSHSNEYDSIPEVPVPSREPSRVIPNDSYVTTDISRMSLNGARSQRSIFQSGLFWDRSMHDLSQLSSQQESVEPLEEGREQTDDEYFSVPEIERRRSQFNLLKSHFSHPSVNIFGSTQLDSPNLNAKPKRYYIDNPQEFVYDTEDSEMTRRYRAHFEIMNEYAVFGTVERGMYRYYSLKT